MRGLRNDENLKAAKTLRQSETLPEAKLWEQLRNRQLEGFKFRRQAPIGKYVVDFVCVEKRLIVELDGWTHSTSAEITNDQRCTTFLNAEGYRVMRVTNIEAMQAIDEVLKLILDELQK